MSILVLKSVCKCLAAPELFWFAKRLDAWSCVLVPNLPSQHNVDPRTLLKNALARTIAGADLQLYTGFHQQFCNFFYHIFIAIHARSGTKECFIDYPRHPLDIEVGIVITLMTAIFATEVANGDACHCPFCSAP